MPVTAPQATGVPGHAAGNSLVEEFESAGELLSDAVRLTALEARRAIGSAALAVVLLLMAAVGAVTASIVAVVALAFALQSLGMSWPAALLVTAATVAGLCYAAVRVARHLLRRLTLPQTRGALRPVRSPE